MAAQTPDRLHLFGIRHHGPGSARGVLTALEAAGPAIVLIEGPPDGDDMIRFAASPAMTPPVALLVHAQDDPSNASFFPFAVFSPEWQAMRWALARQRPARFIDLPMSNRLAERARQAAEDTAHDEAPPDAATNEPKEAGAELKRIRCDPLAYLAALAGYDDSEAWWNALVEQGAHGPEIFAALEAAITALRERFEPLQHQSPAEARTEQQREAHMRLAIAEALAETSGPVAVVCGAWHIPALRRKVAAKDDRALLKGLAKIKVTATWVPWTDTRLAVGSGYGAGVVSPGWYAHLWQGLQPGQSELGAAPLTAHAFTTRWQAKIADLVRKNGRPASTASVIEATRLAISLASLRDLALPGLEEMREASLATLCEGETAPFRLIEERLVIGQGVGEIDEGVPQMPLAADLARWQRKLHLKPEALDTDISLDLRSEAGRAKSLLLHRLALINVPWGRVQSTGQSRGTFRENWRLRWEPEFSVRLAEALVHGTTVEQAAGNAAIAAAQRAASLEEISNIVRGCLYSGLEQAAGHTIARLQRQSTTTSDIASLAGAIPPLADILRYGTARAMPTQALRLLVTSLTEAVCVSLVYACRNLQDEVADDLRTKLRQLDVAVNLIEDAALSDAWHRALNAVTDDASAHPLLRGQATRALYDHGILAPQSAALQLSRALSHSVPASAAGDWLDGFVGQSGQILLHDRTLRQIIDRWIISIGADEFNNLLPGLRRAFSSFDRNERRRLLDDLAKMPPAAPPSATAQPASARSAPSAEEAPGFAAALPLLLTILGVEPAKETLP